MTIHQRLKWPINEIFVAISMRVIRTVQNVDKSNF